MSAARPADITYDQRDVFVLSAEAKGVQKYQPFSSYHDYQYIMVEGLKLPAGDASDLSALLPMLVAHKTNSAVETVTHAGWRSDSKVLSDELKMMNSSVQDVLQSIGMDVPDRERLGRLGDVSQYSEGALLMADMRSFFENQLRNEIDSTMSNPGGWMTDISPMTWGDADPA